MLTGSNLQAAWQAVALCSVKPDRQSSMVVPVYTFLDARFNIGLLKKRRKLVKQAFFWV
jgi:hypothetical protein